jgi:hypothetical protein
MSRTRGAAALAAVLAACSPAVPSQQAVPPPPVVSASSAPAPPPVASASVTATATTVTVAPPVSLFSPALTSPASFQTYRVSNALIVAPAWSGSQLAVAEGDSFVLHPELGKGLPEGRPGNVTKMVGRYPDPLWLLYGYVEYGGQLDVLHEEVYRLQKTRWQRVDRASPDHSYVGLWEAPAGCLLGLVSDGHPTFGHYTSKAQVRIVDCKGHTPRLPGLAHGAEKGIGRLIYQVAGSTSGDLYFLDEVHDRTPGQPPKSNPLLLEIWRHGDPAPFTSVVPMPPEVPATAYISDLVLLPTDGAEVYVSMNVFASAPDRKPGEDGRPFSPWILRFDGSTWTPLERPPLSLYTGISLGTDGTFALLREAWRDHETNVSAMVIRRPGQPWSSLGALPPTLTPRSDNPRVHEPTDIVARSADDVWVVGFAKGFGVTVFHTRPPANGVLLLKNE